MSMASDPAPAFTGAGPEVMDYRKPMLNSATFDIALSLFVIYVYLSLVASALNEWFAAMLQRRGKLLYDTIVQMLGKGTADQIYKDPQIVGLRESKSKSDRFPTEIPPNTFVQVLIRVICGRQSGDQPANRTLSDLRKILEKSASADNNGEATVTVTSLTPAVKSLLLAILDDIPAAPNYTPFTLPGTIPASGTNPADPVAAAAQMTVVRQRLSEWYSGHILRAQGAYKRKTQLQLVFWAFGLSLFLNADSIKMAQILTGYANSDPPILSKFVEIAQNPGGVPKQGAGAVTSDTAKMQENFLKQVTDVPLPLGWYSDDLDALTNSWKLRLEDFRFCLKKALGLILTTIAVSQGAPFWFDILSRFSSLRLRAPYREEKQATG